MLAPMKFNLRSQFQSLTCSCILLGLCVILIIVGVNLKSKFVNGDCCDMTYSRYQFVPIQLTDPSYRNDSILGTYTKQMNQNRYRLLKFVDSRDPRMWSTLKILSKTKDVKNERETSSWPLEQFSRWCQEKKENNPGHVVLYVPGHWGTYDQARSLGAHGLRLTGKRLSRSMEREIVNSIVTKVTNANATGHNFLYDVYSIDFDNGEGSAFHGSTLIEQATFVRYALEILEKSCAATSITLVGHSIGGIIVRAAPILHHLYPSKGYQHLNKNKNTNPINNLPITAIITLATPHHNFPYAFDQSVSQFFKVVNQWWMESSSDLDCGDCSYYRKIPVVSISGGLQDELVHPSFINVEKYHPFSISILASDVTVLKESSVSLSFGMDHRAITWCHQLLTSVRSIIDVTSKRKIDDVDLQLDITASGRDIVRRDFLGGLFRNVSTNFVTSVTRTEQLMQESHSSTSLGLINLLMAYNYAHILAVYSSLAVIFHILAWRSKPITRAWGTEAKVVLLSTTATRLFYSNSLVFSALSSFTAYAFYVFSLQILLPSCYQVGTFVQRNKQMQQMINWLRGKKRNIFFLIHYVFLCVTMFGAFTSFLSPSEISKLFLAAQGLSFLFLIFLVCFLIVSIAFFPPSATTFELKQIVSKEKSKNFAQSHFLMRRNQERRLILVALISPIFFFGKILYCVKLITFHKESPATITYPDHGFELMTFSFQFLVPVMWLLYTTFDTQSNRIWGEKIKVYRLIVFFSLYLNLNAKGMYQFFGLILSSSAALQITGLMKPEGFV